MNIFLIGGAGSLMDSLIVRFNKEGHKLFILTGKRYNKDRYKKVFEQYDFDYDNENMFQIFESVRPDVTIFLGAHDSNFTWENENIDSVKYSSGLKNIITAYSALRIGRFIYLSTVDIYENGSLDNITEYIPATAHTIKGMTITDGEDICEKYSKSLGLDIIVLRLDRLYRIPRNRQEIDNDCARLCFESVEGHIINWNESHIFSLIDESDAVEFIYKTSIAQTHSSSRYNISSSEAVSEEQIAYMIEKEGYVSVVTNKIESEPMRRVLSNTLYGSEFGMRFFSNAEKMVHNTLKYMWEHRMDYIEKRTRGNTLLSKIKSKIGWLLSVFLPYIENLICFIPFFMLNNRAVGSKYFDRLDFYLLYVLLFAIIYGQQQSTFSAILAVSGYIFRQMYTKSGFEVLLSYNTYIWMAQLFIVSLVVGYMRDRLQMQKEERKEEEIYLNNRISDISDINSSNVRVKDSLQTQIINQNNSVGKIYEITSSLNQYSPDEVLFYAVEIVAKLMGSNDAAIYLVSNRDFARLFSSTSDKARILGTSIRYREMEYMYESLSNRQVFINRKLETPYPMMANAVFQGDDMQIIIMIWGLPWESMTIGQANMLSVVSALVEDAVLRAGQYMSALEQERYDEDDIIMKKDAFASLIKAYFSAKKKGLTECTLLKYITDSIHEDAAVIRKGLRQSDYIGLLDDRGLYVLLANTSNGDAGLVLNRFAGQGLNMSIVEDTKLYE